MELYEHLRGCVLSILVFGFGFTPAANAQNSQQNIPQNISCGTDYTVKPGDYLSTIAKQVYGEFGAYDLIYSYNQDVIGANPEVITPGLVLQIPCFESETTIPTVQPPPSTNTNEDANDPPYRFVLYNQWAPFLDENSESGGMLTEIVQRALEESDTKPEYKMHFVSDFNFILDPLLVDHAYDMSVGYTKPKCEKYDDLGEESRLRCDTLHWSQPLYEEVIAYHSLTELPSLNQHSELFGKRICRPDGYTTADMDTAGVKEPAVTMVRPQTAADCVAALIDGTADFAALAIDVAQGHAKELDAESLIKVHESLNHASTVHVVIAKSHPKSDNMMSVVDNGLDKLKNSGDWFNIVRRHMSEHRKKTL